MKYVIGNWKMNPTSSGQARQLLKNTRKNCLPYLKKVKVVLAPPFVYLEKLAPNFGQINSAAQDVFWAEHGAYTGEISASMLKKLGVKYVNIGHVERRIFASETDTVIAKKILASANQGLHPILCVGGQSHPLAKASLATKKNLVAKQLKVLKVLSNKQLKKTLVAYEPPTAIGTGKVTSEDEIRQMALYIKHINSQVSFLYGGSVTGANAQKLFNISELDGVLVGGASLRPLEFAKIVKIASLV